MTGLGQEYSRHSFEQSRDSETLARDLSGILAQRLNAAKNPRSEADAVVEELKLLGHLLFLGTKMRTGNFGVMTTRGRARICSLLS